MKSEFGRGYATCLYQFVMHEGRLQSTIDTYAKLHQEHPDLFDDQHAAEIWMNGASDHLYDLIRPRSVISHQDFALAKHLQSVALDIGHGFHGHGSTQDCRDLLELAKRLLQSAGSHHPVDTLEACLNADRSFGLRPERGAWSCSDLLKAWD